MKTNKQGTMTISEKTLELVERDGYEIAKMGGARVPHHSQEVQDAVRGLAPGQGSDEVFEAFNRGFDKYVNRQVPFHLRR